MRYQSDINPIQKWYQCNAISIHYQSIRYHNDIDTISIRCQNDINAISTRYQCNVISIRYQSRRYQSIWCQNHINTISINTISSNMMPKRYQYIDINACNAISVRYQSIRYQPIRCRNNIDTISIHNIDTISIHTTSMAMMMWLLLIQGQANDERLFTRSTSLDSSTTMEAYTKVVANYWSGNWWNAA